MNGMRQDAHGAAAGTGAAQALPPGKVILERQYNGFLGPQSSDIEITAFRNNAMVVRDTQPGQEVYVEGAVRSRTYEINGQTRWTTDLMARDAIVLDTPQAQVAAQGPKGPQAGAEAAV